MAGAGGEAGRASLSESLMQPADRRQALFIELLERLPDEFFILGIVRDLLEPTGHRREWASSAIG